MEKSVIIKVGGSLVSALLTTASLVLNAKDVAPDKGLSWQWLSVGGFVVFLGFVAWGWGAQYLRTRQLEDKRPTVDMKPCYAGRKAWFDVRNIGAHSSKFTIRLQLEGAKVVGINEESFTFDAKWGHTKDLRSLELMSKETHEIDIIESHGIEGFEEKEKREGLVISTAFETKGATMPLEHTLFCQVEVFSEPPLKQPFKKLYRLLLGKDGKWEKFSEVK